jgi:hypothetical protein
MHNTYSERHKFRPGGMKTGIMVPSPDAPAPAAAIPAALRMRRTHREYEYLLRAAPFT